MVVAHNLQAANHIRQMNIVSSKNAKTTEKLSSGLAINRSADNASSLAISEKLRRQIRGLSQGAINLQDGISYAQVADGALDEISNILQRINELSVKAANDTNTKVDREYIQAEINALSDETNRILKSTSFNEQPLWDTDYSSLSASGSWTPTMDGETIGIGGSSNSINGLTKYDTLRNQLRASIKSQATTSDDSKLSTLSMYFDYHNGNSLINMTISVSTTLDAATKQGLYSSDTNIDGDIFYYLDETLVDSLADGILNDIFSQSLEIGDNGYTSTDTYLSGLNSKITIASTESKELDLQWGAESTSNLKLFYESLNIGVLGLTDINVESSDAAAVSIASIKHAMEIISSQRSQFGVFQNRLEHSVNNINNVIEHTTAAESTIRDTDISKYMVEYSKNNILLNVGQTLSSQIAKNNEAVLSLLNS